MKKHTLLIGVLALTSLLAGLGPACAPATPAPPPTPLIYSQPELEYHLWAFFGDVFWCDPYLWPLARPDQEKQDAVAQFGAIRASDEFTVILRYLSLDFKENYTEEEMLLVFRQHNKLAYSIEMTPDGNLFDFNLRVGSGEGYRYVGTITQSGVITIDDRTTSVNTCPICLAEGTLIATPAGPVPVEDLRPGMAIWTADEAGRRITATVLDRSATPVPPRFPLVQLTLSDGRTVTASPGHPTAWGRMLGDYRVGDRLEGAAVIATRLAEYGGEATYDILPSGPTGRYWAGGILLSSTLSR